MHAEDAETLQKRRTIRNGMRTSLHVRHFELDVMGMIYAHKACSEGCGRRIIGRMDDVIMFKNVKAGRLVGARATMANFLQRPGT